MEPDVQNLYARLIIDAPLILLETPILLPTQTQPGGKKMEEEEKMELHEKQKQQQSALSVKISSAALIVNLHLRDLIQRPSPYQLLIRGIRKMGNGPLQQNPQQTAPDARRVYTILLVDLHHLLHLLPLSLEDRIGAHAPSLLLSLCLFSPLEKPQSPRARPMGMISYLSPRKAYRRSRQGALNTMQTSTHVTSIIIIIIKEKAKAVGWITGRRIDP